MPNPAVDVNSWAGSACYPQGSFYPLSDGPSIRYRRITNPDFRPCSSCWNRSQARFCIYTLNRSQARFCIYTLHLVSIQTERTFGRLRYSLGGDRPSQTARLALSAILRSALGLQITRGGIPTSAPKILAYLLLRLPPWHCLRSTICVRASNHQGRYPNVGSKDTGVPSSSPPAYPVHDHPKPNTRLQ